MDQPLNEAFASKILQGLWSVPMCKKTLLHILKSDWNIDINQIVDTDFQVLSGRAAARINSDSVWKFWSNNGPAQTIMITHSNSLFDKWFEVKRNRRNAKSIPGSSTISEQVYIEYAEGGKRYIEQFKTCYVLDVAALKKRNDRGAIRTGRQNTREGAVALMSDSEIKKANIKRYVDLIRKNKISDGSEFNLINSVTKYFGICIKNNGPVMFLERLIKEGFIVNYISGYADLLMESIRVLNRYGFTLNDKEIEQKFSWDKSEEDKYHELRDKLSKAAERVSDYLSKKYEYAATGAFKEGIRIILNDPKTCQEFITELKGSPRITNADDFEELVKFVQTINKEIPAAFSNPHISSDLLNFDTFVMQLNGIRQLDSGWNGVAESIIGLGYYKHRKDKGMEPDIESLGYRIRELNVGYFKRVEAFLRMIKGI